MRHSSTRGRYLLSIFFLIILFCGTFYFSTKTILPGKDAESASYYIHRIKKKVKSEIGSEEDPGARARYEFERLKNPFTGKIPENIRAKELSFTANLPRK